MDNTLYEWPSRILNVNGIRIHAVEADGSPGPGSGRMVLLVHGFPESWYSWRHQLRALATAGYRAVAIDVRGYGRSSAPPHVEDYRMTQLVADNLGVVEALGERSAVIVGHDWGAPIAWSSAWMRPDVFTAVAGLSVPFAGRGPTRPTMGFRAMGGEEEFYIEYFQQPGRAERELEVDVRNWLLGFYYSISGSAPTQFVGGGTVGSIPWGHEMKERFVYPESDAWPDWMSAADLDFYTAEFERTGFTGGLNRYRNVDRDWEDQAHLAGRPIEVPALFIGGDRDGPTIWGRAAIERFPLTLPLLTRSIILDGCGHWTQQERAAEVNAALVEFLLGLG
jgi:pimeloyl-ACP methyl ester carboxylesterase